jgi:signal transduction histidine kinase/ActR/RegA family two-component response regulator
MNISTICIFAALATLSCAGGLCLVLSLAVFAASAALYAAARRNMRKERPDGPRQEQSATLPSRLLTDSSRVRSTLMKLATYQDAETLREVAMRETGQMLGASATLLFRNDPDGAEPLAYSWFEDGAPRRIPDGALRDSGVTDSLDEGPFVLYSRGRKEGANAVWDGLLDAFGADAFLAAPLRVDGDLWGHVSYVMKQGAALPADAEERLQEACALVQIALSRSRVIEERESNRKQLAAAVRAASRAARAKTLFLSAMSHDIRTPLSAIVGFSEFLADPAVTQEEIKEYTAGISQSADALLAVVGDVLDLSRLESGKIDMSGTCDLVGVFAEIARVFGYRARSKAVSIEAQIDPAFPALRISEDHMRQMLVNIVGNAFKFTESGKIELSAESRPDGAGTVALHIAVKDTGCGIPPERLAHLFDPPAEDGAADGSGLVGPGLGLSVVKRLLDSCGGTIYIDSAVGRGTSVYIRIGRLALAEKPDDAAAKNAASAVPDDFSVLAVDDVAVNLKVLALRVKKAGVSDIRTASSGEEALKLFAERRPRLVLTDLWMPGMDGVALAAAIRKEGGSMPIIAITADSDAKASFDMSEFDGIITKPVSHDKLRAVIARAAKSSRPQLSARAQKKA